MGRVSGQRLQPHLGLVLKIKGGIQGCFQRVGLRGFQQLESLPSPQEAAVLKHVPAHGVQCPVASFAGTVWAARDFDKAVIERQVVPEGVLPTLSILPVVGKPVGDELVDLKESHHLVRRALDGHGCQGDVGIRRFLVRVRIFARTRHGCCDCFRFLFLWY